MYISGYIQLYKELIVTVNFDRNNLNLIVGIEYVAGTPYFWFNIIYISIVMQYLKQLGSM